MHRMTLPSELAKRLSCTSATAISARNPLREELAEQIAEFKKNGGQIQEIPRGLGTYGNGEVALNQTPGASIAVCRPNNRVLAGKVCLPRKPKKEKKVKRDETEGGKYVNQTQAAAMMGIHSSYFACMRQRDMINIEIKKTVACVHYFLTSDIAALGKYQRKDRSKKK